LGEVLRPLQRGVRPGSRPSSILAQDIGMSEVEELVVLRKLVHHADEVIVETSQCEGGSTAKTAEPTKVGGIAVLEGTHPILAFELGYEIAIAHDGDPAGAVAVAGERDGVDAVGSSPFSGESAKRHVVSFANGRWRPSGWLEKAGADVAAVRDFAGLSRGQSDNCHIKPFVSEDELLKRIEAAVADLEQAARLLSDLCPILFDDVVASHSQGPMAEVEQRCGSAPHLWPMMTNWPTAKEYGLGKAQGKLRHRLAQRSPRESLSFVRCHVAVMV